MDIITAIDPVSNSGSNIQSSNDLYYVVYEAGANNGIPHRDIAFIEQRTNVSGLPCELAEDEVCFPSLKEAKSYVKEQFNSGAEYFSLNQSNDPDSVLHLLVDKLTYLLA